jgi:hypothetical protein
MIWPAVLLAGLLAGCSGAPEEGVSPEAPTVAAAASPPPTMGTPVRDGGLEFIVNGVRLGPSISTGQARYKAHGRYVIVGMSVTNVGDQPETYTAADQKLIVDGKRYDYAAEPTILMNTNATSQLNPGIDMTTLIAYDVPAGTRPSRIELHGAAGTAGVDVDLAI